MSPFILNQNVLVLNKHFVPINVTNVESSVCLIYANKAEIVVHENITDKFGRLLAVKYDSLNYQRWIEISESLDENKYAIIHSSRYKHFLPKVIILKAYGDYPKYFIKLNKTALYARDNGECQYCSTKVSKYSATIDHVVPKSRGGKNTWDNLVLACKECNTIKKRSKLLSETNLHLKKRPIKPTEINFKDIYKNEFIFWKDFFNKNEK